MVKEELQRNFWGKDKSNRREAKHPVVEYVYKNMAIKLKSLLNNVPIKSILDCGCGNGFFQTYLSEVFGLECAGIDFSKEMIRLNPNPRTYLASVTKIPFKDNSFDLVTCSQLLHHLSEEERLKALEEMRRVAKKYIFIAEPNRNNPFNTLFFLAKQEELGGLVFTTEYLKNLCRKRNLFIVKLYIDSLVLPNKTPLFLFPFFKILDKTFLNSWFGFNINFLCKK
jgi:SAM-dependent methyltransferase